MQQPFQFPYKEREGYHGPGHTVSNPNNVQLFTPITYRNMTLPNRIVVSPMCQYSSFDGFMNDWHLMHLGGFAKGGAGLIFTEATAVEPIGRISPEDAGLWKDEQIAPMKRIVDFVHALHGKIGIQLAHSGRKGSTFSPFSVVPRAAVLEEEGGWVPAGPTGEPWGNGYPSPKELSKDDIKRIVDAFAAATRRSLQCGFDVIEIHGAHGYLISSFNSPFVNTRTDEYGGSFENRIRFCLEVVDAVRKEWPEDRPLFVRLSCSDWVEGGWDIEQTVRLTKILKSRGVDLIDCSSGGNTPLQKLKDSPGYQVPFAEQVKKEVPEIGVGAVGKITEAKQAEEIVSTGKADIVLLAREFLRNPHFVLYAAKDLGVKIDWPLQYERAAWH